MDELVHELQLTIDKLVSYYAPGCLMSSEFRQKLLFSAHVYGLGVAREMNKELMLSISRPIIICTSEEHAERLKKEIEDGQRRVPPQDPGGGPGRYDPQVR